MKRTSLPADKNDNEPREKTKSESCRDIPLKKNKSSKK